MAAVVTTEEFQHLMGKTGFESVPHEKSAGRGFLFYAKPWLGKRVEDQAPLGRGCNVIVEFAGKTAHNPTPWWRFWLADGIAEKAVDRLWEDRPDGSCRLTQQYTSLGAPIFLEESVKGLSPHDLQLITNIFRLIEDDARAMTEEGKAAKAAAEAAAAAAAQEKQAAYLRDLEEAKARIEEEKRRRAQNRARIASLPPYATTQQLHNIGSSVRGYQVTPHFEPFLPPGGGTAADWKLFCKNTTLIGGDSVLHEWTWQRVEIPEE